MELLMWAWGIRLPCLGMWDEPSSTLVACVWDFEFFLVTLGMTNALQIMQAAKLSRLVATSLPDLAALDPLSGRHLSRKLG